MISPTNIRESRKSVDLSGVWKRHEDLSPSERFNKRKELLNKFKSNVLNLSHNTAAESVTPDPQFEKILRSTFSHTKSNETGLRKPKQEQLWSVINQFKMYNAKQKEQNEEAQVVDKNLRNLSQIKS